MPRRPRPRGSHPSIRGGIHPTEKPPALLDPLIRSGATLEAARAAGRAAIGIEAHEPYAEAAARRLSQTALEIPQ